jgi:N-formylglutamate amidohydrolase
MIPIIVHVPHASRDIPEEARDDILLDDEELRAELLAMTDAWTDELMNLAEHYDAQSVVAPISRLVCDVERFRDDAQEEMSQIGMGAVYSQTSDGRQLRRVTSKMREKYLQEFYDPHHRLLEAAVDGALSQTGTCLVLDIHSFPSKPLPYEQDQRTERPEVCIGFDSQHGRFLEEDEWKRCCDWARFEGDVNRPFSGSIVPLRHLGNDNVLSAMIEVRRDLYMNEATGEKLDEFDSVAHKLNILAVAIASSATKHVELKSRLSLPYEARVPLLWSDSGERLLHLVTKALGTEGVQEALQDADELVESVISGERRPSDPAAIPRNEEEIAHFREVTRREFLASMALERISDEGQVIENYDWDGAGLATSPGSSFYAFVNEWNGLYGWFSDVDSAGPFADKDIALKGMREHCGVD